MVDFTDEQNFIYEHVQHQDEMFYQRANFFLLAESMVLIAYSLLISRKDASFQAHVIAGFGLVVTAIWGYSGHVLIKYFGYVTRLAERDHPHYGSIRIGRPQARVGPHRLMGYVVP